METRLNRRKSRRLCFPQNPRTTVSISLSLMARAIAAFAWIRMAFGDRLPVILRNISQKGYSRKHTSCWIDRTVGLSYAIFILAQTVSNHGVLFDIRREYVILMNFTRELTKIHQPSSPTSFKGLVYSGLLAFKTNYSLSHNNNRFLRKTRSCH